jgi:hypothetical protein
MISLSKKMGLAYVDFWTFMHFFWGIVITSVLFPSSPELSIVISNVLHLILELTEHDYGINGEHLESTENHIGDLIGFLLGSLIAYFFGCKYFTQKGTETLRWTLMIAAIIAFIQEVGRELFPETWFLSPAYYKRRVFGYDVNHTDWYNKIFELIL